MSDMLRAVEKKCFSRSQLTEMHGSPGWMRCCPPWWDSRLKPAMRRGKKAERHCIKMTVKRAAMHAIADGLAEYYQARSFNRLHLWLSEMELDWDDEWDW